MSEEEKLAAGAEAAADYLKGVTVVKAELRGSQYWAYKTEMFENEHLEQEERTVVAGVYDLEGGEWVARYSAKELWERYKAGEEVLEKMVFDGEIVEKVWDTESALGRAQEATYKGVEYPAGVDVWENAAGEMVLVDWAYYPGGAHELMSVAETPDGRLVVLQPVGTEVKYDLSGVSKGELDQIYAVLLRPPNNKDLEAVLRNPRGSVIVVLGLQATTQGYWSGDESEERQSTLMEFRTPAKIQLFTADRREDDIVVTTDLYTDLLLTEFKLYLTERWIADRGGSVSEALASADQTPTSARGDKFETDYVNPREQITKLLAQAGFIIEFIQ
ncbi:MAG: hypothetical protein HND47_04255 [Chloroflexi bacterium]|nr:hypothetical protein [Chloroflexota bacterium]